MIATPTSYIRRNLKRSASFILTEDPAELKTHYPRCHPPAVDGLVGFYTGAIDAVEQTLVFCQNHMVVVSLDHQEVIVYADMTNVHLRGKKLSEDALIVSLGQGRQVVIDFLGRNGRFAHHYIVLKILQGIRSCFPES